MRRVITLLAMLAIAVPLAGSAASVAWASGTRRPETDVAPAAAAPGGALGYWSLDEALGSSAADSSGNGNDGSVVGATWVGGMSGSALSFDGSGDRVVVPGTAALEPAAVSVAAWMKGNANPGAWRSIISKGELRCQANSWALGTNPTGALFFGMWNGTTVQFSPEAGPDVWDGNWHLTVGTFDGSALRLYVDGSLIGSTATTGSIRYGLADGSDLVIGALKEEDQCGLAAQFAGAIDEVGIWGRALSQAEIQTLIPPAPTALSLTAAPTSVVSGEGLVTFAASAGSETTTGTVEFWDISTTPTLLGNAALVPVAGGIANAVLKARLFGAGIHTVEARYDGDAGHRAAVSPSVTVVVSPDSGVTATGVGVQYATFYPYKDSYRDTVAIRGTPGEPMKSVLIRVYNSSGRKVRAWSLATRTSAWSIAWNGRNAAGTRLAAGKYKVVQRLTDTLGHTKSYTAYTTLSNKRLYWYSGSQTRYADSGTFSVTGAGAEIISAADEKYRAIAFIALDDRATGRYSFTLPSAATYSSIRASVYGYNYRDGAVGGLGIVNYATNLVEGTGSIGYTFSGSDWDWFSSKAVGAANHVKSRIAKAEVSASGSWLPSGLTFQKVKLSYRYGILK